ncbi:MAG TPA: (p)ppGpp synthetase [Treponemataceae bacterium]|nr:(p)ppGpp synthetase [Treponemataceae bacterium]
MNEPGKTDHWLPNREVLALSYSSHQKDFQLLLERIESRLRTGISVSSVPTFKSRVKCFNSYYRKLLRNLPKDISSRKDLPIVSDIIGIRIICAFLEDLARVEEYLHKCFTVYEVERKGADRTFREFGYESTHIILAIPEELTEGLSLPKDLLFEIQVRTILQDAWAEVEHELVYKSEFSPFDLPLKRKLASINASLSLADIIFQEIRDYQNKLNRELDKRRGSFYQQADFESEMTLQPAVSNNASNSLNGTDGSMSYVQGTIDDMILAAIEAHNVGNLERASIIYTHIIDAKPNNTVLSVMYKHRGMAYFAQSKYENALSDFKNSAKTKPDNFRAYYYIAIVLSVLGKNSEAVENFTLSLELNHFQPYVYFRRAQAYYHLGFFSDALSDLDKAVSLGFDKAEEKQLRLLIAKNLDIT